MEDLGAHYLASITQVLESQKRLAEGAFVQLDEADYFWTPDPESNSIAVIVAHMHGNMRSRWTDFLESDGEKPDRDRDGEFAHTRTSVARVRALWDEGWRTLFAALSELTPRDLTRTVTIRGEPQSALQAIERQASHYAYHVGQIVYIAKHRRAESWDPLSLPAKRRGPGPIR